MHKVNCTRCSGKGTLKQFSHVLGGTCFKCSGRGFTHVKSALKKTKSFNCFVFMSEEIEEDPKWILFKIVKTKKAAENWVRNLPDRKFIQED